MRTIKFRAWDKIDRKIIEVMMINFEDKKVKLFNHNTQESYIRNLDEVLLLEYAGFKDNNGKEIYEKDIVHCYGGEYFEGKWEFDVEFVMDNFVNDCFALGKSENIEIIGNIFENPELLPSL